MNVKNYRFGHSTHCEKYEARLPSVAQSTVSLISIVLIHFVNQAMKLDHFYCGKFFIS